MHGSKLKSHNNKETTVAECHNQTSNVDLEISYQAGALKACYFLPDNKFMSSWLATHVASL